MKKIYLLLLLPLFFQPAFSQEKVIYADKNNLQKEITALFNRADRAGRALKTAPAARFTRFADSAALAPVVSSQELAQKGGRGSRSQIDSLMSRLERQIKQKEETLAASWSYSGATSAALRKPWQVAFMMMDVLPSTAVRRLENKVKEGVIAQASFVVWENMEELELSDDMTLWEQMAAGDNRKLKGSFYMMYASPDGAVTERVRFECEPEIDMLLDMLFNNLNLHSRDLHTALVLFAHGNGATMMDGEDSFAFELGDVMGKVENLGLHLDILDLVSCHMGSLRTLYLTARTGVDYAMFSSDTAAGGVMQRASRLLRFLGLGPKRAVTQSVSSNPTTLPVWRANELAYDVQLLREPFLQWAEQSAAMIKHAPQGTAQALVEGKDYESYYLFDDFVKEQMSYVRTHLDVKDPVNKEFLRGGERLLGALKESKLAEWCMRESKCTRGISYRVGDLLYLWSKYDVYVM